MEIWPQGPQMFIFYSLGPLSVTLSPTLHY